MTPARFALTEAFGLFLHGADNDKFSKPTYEQDQKSKALKKSQPKKKPIRYAERNGTQMIIELPELRTATGKTTWVGRTSTNHRCAVAIDAGKILTAALNQAEIKARWLEYVYDPYFDIDPGRQRRRFEQVIFPGVCALWAFSPYKRKAPTAKQFPRFLQLVACCIDSYSRYARSGLAGMKLTATQKAQALGYGSQGAYKAANWSEQWAWLDRDVMAVLERLDEVAMAPVVVAFSRQLEARREDRQAMIKA